MAEPDKGSTAQTRPSDRYRHLPDPVRLEDTVATKDTGPAPDPDSGRDPERDFMLRYAG